MSYIEQIKSKISELRCVDILTEDMVWQEHGTLIWRAEKFDGFPFFYNIYRYQDYYSFSLLALILLKNNLKPNKLALDIINAPVFDNLPGNMTVDNEIEKLGGPFTKQFDLNNIDEYCTLLAKAMIKDIDIIEEKHPGKTNIIMCGGRDSMNLLLLPWKNPVVAFSAQPNFPLVASFIKNNKLNIELFELKDNFDEKTLKDELVEACCRTDLAHWRWGADLIQTSKKYERNAILWKGQLGDVFMTDSWKHFITPYVEPQRTVRRIYKKISYLLPQFINHKIGKKYQPVVINRVWEVCSSLQGGHVSFLRALMDMLVLSAYNGPNVSKVLERADLGALCQNDIRPKVGKILFGKNVFYPAENPHPEMSNFRENLHSPKLFYDALRAEGVEIIEQSRV